MSYHLLSETFPVARKPHRCIWCGEAIPAGEKYRHEKSVYDGNMQDHKWHLECEEASAEEFKRGEEEFDRWENERPSPNARHQQGSGDQCGRDAREPGVREAGQSSP